MKKIGDIQIFAEIKRSDHGSTYRGLDAARQRLVLVKTFERHGDAQPSHGAGSRFEQEAAIYAQIDHPNVVRLYDYGVADGVRFLTLEFVEGQNLRSLLQHRAPMPTEIALAIFCGVLEGVQEIHRRNFIHRDLKPENILIGNDGSVKICDFDLAIREDDHHSSGLTGSPGYMAPEAILGEKITFAADIFSLGILLYEVLAGVRPFHGSSASGEMNAIVRVAHLPLAKVNRQASPPLEDLLNRLLAKKPQERMKSARELLAWLANHFVIGTAEARREIVKKYAAAPQAYQPVEFLATPPPEKIFREKSAHRSRARRRRIRSIALAGIALSVFGLFYWQLHQADNGGIHQQSNLVSGVAEKDEISKPNSEPAADVDQKRGEEQPVANAAKLISHKITSDSIATLGGSKLASPPVTHALIIHSNPWAYLFIDGDSIGMTPLSAPLRLSESSHEFTFKNPKLPPVSFAVAIDARTPDTLSFSLWERVAQLEVQITPWAEMFVDGERRELPAGERMMILRPGKYALRFVHPQLGEKTETIFLRAGEMRRLEINMF